LAARSTGAVNAIYQPPPAVKKYPVANLFLKNIFLIAPIIATNRHSIGPNLFTVTERLI
jgi:hypothetical protein